MKLFRHRLEITAKDATSFLHRLLSHDFVAGKPGYGLLLEPNGRLVAGAYWIPTADGWLALGSETMMDALEPALQRYIFFRDEVQVTRLPPVLVELSPSPAGSFHDTGIPTQITAMQAADTGEYDPCAVQRRLAGFPLLGIEFVAGDLALEWDYGFAIAPKGCFPGQEVIERMTSRKKRARSRILCEQIEPGVDLPQNLALDLRTPVKTDGKLLALGLASDKSLPRAKGWRFTRPLYHGTPSMAVSFAEWAQS